MKLTIYPPPPRKLIQSWVDATNRYSPSWCNNIVRNNDGFTLVELSIVLVIIGLLTSGIMVGLEMIESAKERKTISQLESYQTALMGFMLKYDAIPGDFDQAISMLGASSQGNGSGVVRTHWNISNNCDNTNAPEYIGFFNHLKLAGLIKDQNQYEWDTYYANVGVNVPETPFNKIGILFMGTCPGWLSANSGRVQSVFQIGSEIDVGCCNDFLWGSGFNASKSKNIDAKMDDGLPSSGIFTSKNGGFGSGYSTVNPNSNCFILDSATNRNIYNTSVEATGCVNYLEAGI